MDKNLAGLIGAVGVLAFTAPARSATVVPLTMEDAMRSSSYADLLTPIPNALELLRAAIQQDNAPAAGDEAKVETVQFFPHHHHHHHHHHHRRRYYHHHHHHHHNQY